MTEILKAALFGIVEGITEWLPISSTGHLILLKEFIDLNVSKEFWSMFEVVIQLGAILAVVVIFWKKLWPFSIKEKFFIKQETLIMWLKILVSCVPAALVAIILGDKIEELFYNYWVIALALIVFGVAFIVIENRNRHAAVRIKSLSQITFQAALIIGVFQLVAAVFPGTSRSGATILGAILIGVSRSVAAEYTFFLAVPVMFGASLIKLLGFGLNFTGMEMAILLTGMIVAFLVSLFVIRFLMGYIKKHDFKVFGWYRIVLGIAVILYFSFIH
ncbi:undecaprenyl-diphosphate phosphatase [Parasporobacterium paucivorans]|uniref:Undecaprenyl-diphosphatase n=1 Tax=Parasporobacterium paucivorans DSM 15970 TaxID=1122934 RepID=A0A1M6E3H9_9FIRM|nr:undecaprenyl-diphosphate phosphatase [Parasporobacterium paucivorans]SHI80057.1 undecaprenyl-diphosphatase [Parasporobacterium paucivorans DSM 15970]